MKHKRLLSMALSGMMLLSCSMYIPSDLIVSDLEIIGNAAVENFNYSDADVFTADALLAKAVMPDGAFYPPSADMAFGYTVVQREFIYQSVSEEVASNAVEYGSALYWQNLEKTLKGDFKGMLNWEEVMYEALIMDYLAYEGQSEAHKSDLLKSTHEFEAKILNELAKHGVKSLDSLAVEDYWNYAKDINLSMDLNSALGMIGKATNIVKSASNYHDKLCKILAVQKADEDRLAFLKEMKNASTDVHFNNAVAKVISYYEISEADSLEEYLNVYVTVTEAGTDIVLQSAWTEFLAELSVECPDVAAATAYLRLGTAGFDWLCNTNDISDATLQMQLIYNAGLYANMAYRNMRDEYSSSPDVGNATTFIHAYENYIAFKTYANTIVDNYFYQKLCDGAINQIAALFNSGNKTTYETWSQAIVSEKKSAETWLSCINLYRDFYDRMTTDTSTAEESELTPEEAETVGTELNDNILWELAKSEKSYATSLNRWEGDITLTRDMTVSGDLYLTDWMVIDANGNEEYHSFSSLDLNGHTLTINGNLIHKLGNITINNGTLNITGNYSIKNSTVNSTGEVEYQRCNARLFMKNVNDKVNVSGDFVNYGGCELSAGRLSVSRNLFLYCQNYDNCGWISSGEIFSEYNENGGCLVLSGNGDQVVTVSPIEDTYLGDSIYFNSIEVKDYDKRNIVWNGCFNVKRLKSNMNLKSDNLNLIWFDLNKYTVNIDGDVIMDSQWNPSLDGGTLNINGNFTQKQGVIHCNNGELRINGNYYIENTTKNNVGEIEYNTCYAGFTMRNANDKVVINGNLETHKLYEYHYWASYDNGIFLENGELSVAGNIWSDMGFYGASDSHKTVLNGTGEQDIYLAYDSGYNVLGSLYVQNVDNRKINWTGDFKVLKLINDFTINTDDLTIYNCDINGRIFTINGNVKMNELYGYDGVNISGGILNINGDFTHKSGTITCNNGTLNITGNYAMEDSTTNRAGEKDYNPCYADLCMYNKNDKVNVGGNFTTHSLADYPSGNVYFSKGILTVNGDIWSDGGISASDSQSHKTILSGDKTQFVTMSDSEKFDILMLTKPVSNYTFIPDECWYTLVTAESNLGDVNLDGSASVVDVVLLQKYLHNKQKFTKTQYEISDMNGDGKVNIFDLALLKRKLLQK